MTPHLPLIRTLFILGAWSRSITFANGGPAEGWVPAKPWSPPPSPSAADLNLSFLDKGDTFDLHGHDDDIPYGKAEGRPFYNYHTEGSGSMHSRVYPEGQNHENHHIDFAPSHAMHSRDYTEGHNLNHEQNDSDYEYSFPGDIDLDDLPDVESTQHDVESTQHDVESTQHDVESTQHDVDSTQHDLDDLPDVDSTQHDVESTQHDVDSTQHASFMDLDFLASPVSEQILQSQFEKHHAGELEKHQAELLKALSQGKKQGGNQG